MQYLGFDQKKNQKPTSFCANKNKTNSNYGYRGTNLTKLLPALSQARAKISINPSLIHNLWSVAGPRDLVNTYASWSSRCVWCADKLVSDKPL